MPSRWLLLASALDIFVVCILATQGVLMAAIPLMMIFGLMAVVLGYMIVVDFLKIRIFRRLALQ